MKRYEIPLVRIEGDSDVVLFIDEFNKVRHVEFRVFETPRFFEYILRKLHYSMIPDMVSRICGFCGVSYIVSAIKAFEICMDIDIPEEVEEIRELIHLAERAKSHVLHVGLMNLPDILGVMNITEVNRVNPFLFRQVVNLVESVNRLMKITSGRFHNVVNLKTGGVYGLPDKWKLEKLREMISREIIPILISFADVVMGLENVPRVDQQLRFCTIASDRYPWCGLLVDYGNTRHPIDFFYEKLVEVDQVRDKYSLLYRINGGSFVVGPIARFNKYMNYLPGEVKDLLKKYGWLRPLSNIYQSYIARIAEIYDALLNISNIIESLEDMGRVNIDVSIPLYKTPRNNTCFYAIEAPRGILYQRFKIDEKGYVEDINIITPTAQNIAAIEDIARSEIIDKNITEAVDLARKIAVSFDPCTSCSVHGIRIKIVENRIGGEKHHM